MRLVPLLNALFFLSGGLFLIWIGLFFCKGGLAYLMPTAGIYFMARSLWVDAMFGGAD